MKQEFGFGIIGTGLISHIHALAIEAIPGAHLRGVYNIHKEKADHFAAKYGCKAYSTLDDMLASPDIDIACICTPSGLHLEPALKCIEAGKHCLIEKPLEVTLEKCDQIIEAAQKADVKTGVIFPSRFYEASVQMKTAVDEKRFGTLVLGDAYVKWHRSPEYYKSASWRGTWALDGGGALMNQGIHSVDLLQWYMGPVDSVQAFSTNRQHKGIEVEDSVVAVLKFANGALGNIEATTAVYPGELKQIEILGTEGTAVLREASLIRWEFLHKKYEDQQIIDSMSATRMQHGGAANPADLSIVGHQRQIEDMMQAIESGREPLIDAVEGRKSVKIVLAVYESARSGRLIHLNH
ncbi:MAG TPA: Gfo/Idh/MocA family oxidoreductase [Chitinophagaceae bacterium]|nr:Gfo/Idh/MocA family oxidoreductase [Chitinophagaceae bacterium]